METYAKDQDSGRYLEACDWFVQLREAPDDSGVVAAWLAWCAGDALNREAFEQVRQDWVALGLIPHGALEAPAPAVPQSRQTRTSGLGTPGRSSRLRGSILRKVAGVAALGACAGTVWLVWNGPALETVPVSSLSTTPTEHRTVRLDDGSVLDIAGDSRLEVRMSPHRRDIELVRGEAFFSVAHDSSRPFIVRAGPLNVRAVGTRFDVRTADARVVVAVEEGVVEVEPPHDATTAVNAIFSKLHFRDRNSTTLAPLRATSIRSGQEVAVVPDQELQILPIEPTAVASWREGRLRFAREPLKSVIASIRAVSGKQIELADPELAELRFTGTVFSSGVDAWVMALPAVFPVDVHPDGAKFVITHRVGPQN